MVLLETLKQNTFHAPNSLHTLKNNKKNIHTKHWNKSQLKKPQNQQGSVYFQELLYHLYHTLNKI